MKRSAELCIVVVATALVVLPASAAARTHAIAHAATPPATTAPTPSTPVVETADPSAQDSSITGPGPLVANGFGSPACRSPAQLATLSAAARENCEVSGITVVPEPLDNYQFDIHINSGLLGDNVDAIFQDLFLSPIWMGLVWLVHVAVVAVEWCFSFDLLGAGTLTPIVDAMQNTQRVFTNPWLAFVLAAAAITLLYHGLIRRRVAQTLGELALTLGMMAAGLAVIADPLGTVGWLDQLVNTSSLTTVAVISGAGASAPQNALDGGLGDTFDATITGPWCYLEFGDVAWCRDPNRLDPSLRSSARQIAALDVALVQCRGPVPAGLPTCPSRGSPAARELLESAYALEHAQTNGELFLALPANGPQRNSINADPSNPSLLSVLCGSSDATSCTSSTGPQAQFRTQQGTMARAGGLLLIVAGTMGMLALFGFLAIRLLGAAMLAVFLLLLAPVAVLAPALGDGGREAFRRWSTRLLGALIAKFVYSVFLGIVLLLLRVFVSMNALGWWTQWLLTVAFWWIVFIHRHRLLEHVLHERREQPRPSSVTARLFAARQITRVAGRTARMVSSRVPDITRNPPEPKPKTGKHDPIGVGSKPPQRYVPAAQAQVSRTLEIDHAGAKARVATATQTEAHTRELSTRLQRVREARVDARRNDDRRRETSLALREERLSTEIAANRTQLREARELVTQGETRLSRTGSVHDAAQRATRVRKLDKAAAVPRPAKRDYAELAGLAGLTRNDYAGLPPAQRRRAHLQIERQLDLRREKSPAGELPRIPIARAIPVSRRQRQFARHDTGPQR